MSVRTVRGFSRPSFRRAALALVAIALVRSAQLTAQEATAPKTHTVKRGDTLWDLAKGYLGDPFLWPEIYRLNTDIVQDPHWIYPGEVLKLPGEAPKVVAEAPPPAAAPAVPAAPPAAPPAAAPTIPTQPPPERVAAPPVFTNPVAPVAEPARATSSNSNRLEMEPPVRWGEHLAAPWVDKNGGPSEWGRIVRTADLSVHRQSEEHAGFSLYDDILYAPPRGPAAEPRTRYLTFVLGPLIEDFGQIVIPTGVVEVVRPPQNGEMGIARVVKMFTAVRAQQRMMLYDSSAMALTGQPAPVTDGRMGTVRWLYNQPLLPSIQQYLVLDISQREGIALGDRIELYQKRQPPADDGELAMPAISVGRAQIVRVTPYGATALVTAVRQPKILEGTSARVTAKMP